MELSSEERLPYLKVGLVGVGTVFGTMLLCLCFLLASMGLESLPILLIYGVAFSFMLCLAALLPSLAIWRVTVFFLVAAGIDSHRSVLISACFTSFFAAATLLLIVGEFSDFRSALTGLAVVLASVFSTLAMLWIVFSADESEAKD